MHFIFTWINEYIFRKKFSIFDQYEDLEKIDIALFDNSIQLFWIIENIINDKAIGTLSLKLNPDENILTIFDFKKWEGRYYKREKLKEKPKEI